MDPATFLLHEATNHPPTTAEWLGYLRRIGDKTRFLRQMNGRWVRYRRLRPFISPRTHPLAQCTCQGYWWRKLPP